MPNFQDLKPYLIKFQINYRLKHKTLYYKLPRDIKDKFLGNPGDEFFKMDL